MSDLICKITAKDYEDCECALCMKLKKSLEVKQSPQAAPEAGSECMNLLNAARSLVERLDLVHDDPKYQGVWQMAQSRNGQYTGPQYKKELDALREIVLGI
jgi:hypothetical protein